MRAAVTDPIVAGALRPLRRRAIRQRKRGADWTITSAKGVRIVAGEGRIAERIAAALDQAADELEEEAGDE